MWDAGRRPYGVLGAQMRGQQVVEEGVMQVDSDWPGVLHIFEAFGQPGCIMHG